jgi:hypothetical protein
VLPTKKMRSSPTPAPPQVLIGHLAGGEEVVGDSVGHHAVDLSIVRRPSGCRPPRAPRDAHCATMAQAIVR